MTRTSILTATTLAFVVVAGTVFGSVGLATTVAAQESSGTIQGDVTTGEGTPLPGTTVTVKNASGAVVAETTTDDSGGYNVSGLAPGEYTVVAERDGATGESIVPVESGSTVVAGILIVGADPPASEEPGAIRGDVATGEGVPLPGESITVESDSGTVVAETTTDDSGGYTVSGLEPGEYTVVADTGNATGQSTATVEPGETTVSGILVVGAEPPGVEEPGTIQGDVTNGEGTPLPGASVTVENASGTVVAETTTDDSGAYTVTELPPGEYTVVAESDGATGESIVPVESGSTIVADILVVGADPPADRSPERELSSTTVAPGGDVTVTVEAYTQGGAITVNEGLSPDVASVSIESVTVDGESATPLVNATDSTGALVTLSDVSANRTVAVTYTVTVPETADNGTTYTIDGVVTSDGETSIAPSELTVRAGSPLSGTAAEYDTDSDGEISLTEMSQAATDYANEDISLDDLRDVASTYAES